MIIEERERSKKNFEVSNLQELLYENDTQMQQQLADQLHVTQEKNHIYTYESRGKDPEDEQKCFT